MGVTAERPARADDGPKKEEGRMIARLVRLSRRLAVIGLVIVGGFGAYKGLDTVKRLGYFNVKNVSVTGLDKVDRKSVLRLVGPLVGHNIFTCDLQEMGEKVEAHPMVKRVEIRRQLPGGLLIKIEERYPVAVVILSEPWLIDADGVLLEKQASGQGADLPVFTGLELAKKKQRAGYVFEAEKIRPALTAVSQMAGYRLLGKGKLYAVDLSNPESLSISFKNSAITLTAPRWKWSDETLRLKVVDYILRQKNEGNIRSIDLTFVNKVIVTYQKV